MSFWVMDVLGVSYCANADSAGEKIAFLTLYAQFFKRTTK